MIVGVKASWTPNCLNSIVIIAAVPADPDWATGYGNSPPARKLAVWPDTAVRFGSAKHVRNPSVAKRSTVAVICSESMPGRNFVESRQVSVTLPAEVVGR